jgi:hypothetical protein
MKMNENIGLVMMVIISMVIGAKKRGILPLSQLSICFLGALNDKEK